MYNNLKGQVKLKDCLSDPFSITIGLRQGCNLSPYLFNMYVNDLPNLLGKANCNPVLLDNTKINILMYADDMLLLSYSEHGLQRALNILQIYCTNGNWW